MALGAAVGGALPSSRMEDQTFGEHSDRAMEAARTLAKVQGAKVKATASAMVDEALNIADEAAAELGENCPRGKRSSTQRRARSARRQAGSARQAGWAKSPEPSDRPAG